MALTYSWGGTLSLTTISAYGKNHFIKVSDADLPQSFKDAVEITPFLNLSYLSIVLLCISKDNMEDFQTESSKMGSMYSNSVLVFCADCAKYVSRGCFNTSRAEIVHEDDCMCGERTWPWIGKERRYSHAHR